MRLRGIAVTMAGLVAAASISPSVAMADEPGSAGQPVLHLVMSAEGPFGVSVGDYGTSDGSKITAETFDFGDGSAPEAGTSGEEIMHEYAEAGTYTITETATDADGEQLTATGTFTTQGPAPDTLMTASVDGLSWTPSLSDVANAAITPMSDYTDQVVAVTNDGQLDYNILSRQRVWQGWATVAQPGVTVTGADIAGMPNASSQLIEVTSTGVLKHTVRNADGTWQTTGWGSPAGSTGIAQAAIAAMPDGSAQLLAVTTTGVVEHNIRFANGSWQGWRNLTQPGTPVKSVGITGVHDGSSQLVVITTSGVLEHDIRLANGSWQGWRGAGGGTVTQASIGSTSTQFGNGNSGLTTYVTAVTSSGQFELNIRSVSGAWSGWQIEDTSAIGPVKDSGADWFDSAYIALAAD